MAAQPPTPNSLRGDANVIAWVSIAHGLSHFFQMVLPPLFPLMKAEFDLSYTALGLITALFYVVSGVMQPIVGFAVDRFGPSRMLVVALVLASLGLVVIAIAPSYPVMLVGAVIGGFGNSIFHPADLALINARITPARLGPAFSIHNMGGFSGFIVGPLFVVAIAAFAGWRWAIAAAGGIGLVFTLAFLFQRSLATPPIRREPVAAGVKAASDWQIILSAPALLCCTYFFFQAIATVGWMTFGPTALSQVYGIPLVAAAAIITAYFVGSISGTFSGGFGAQKTTNHVGLLVVCVLSAASAMGLIATGMLPVSLLWLPAGAFGFALGFANPSRDIIVRGIAPPHARGKVYGLVYGGMDAGAALAPLPLGWLLDHGYPSALFAVAAIAVLAVLPSVLMLRERTMRAAPA